VNYVKGGRRLLKVIHHSIWLIVLLVMEQAKSQMLNEYDKLNRGG